MGLKTSGETMQSLNNSSRRCVHVRAIFSPPGCALPKWGVGREAMVFTTHYVMQQEAKAEQTVGLLEGEGMHFELLGHSLLIDIIANNHIDQKEIELLSF